MKGSGRRRVSTAAKSTHRRGLPVKSGRARTPIPHSRPTLTVADRRAVDDVVISGMLAEGDRVKEFEGAMARYLGLAGGVAASTGADALFLALKGLNIGGGDEVILPTYTCRAVWDAVAACGARPVLCDVDEDWCMSVETVKPCLTRRTKALILVHVFGIAAKDTAALCKMGVPVIEDCCQSLGAALDGRMCGTFGQACVLSFHATKLLATGEGGMVLAGNHGTLERLRLLKHGRPGGLVARHRSALTDLQAALGLSQLGQYDRFLAQRRRLADLYFSQLAGLSVDLPESVRDRSIHFRFPLKAPGKFETLQTRFLDMGIHVRRGVDALLHTLAGMRQGRFPRASAHFERTLSIPLYPALRDDECERIVAACRRILR